MIFHFPFPTQNYQQTQIDLNKILVKDPINTFFFHVYGDSMEGAGIYDQDEIIVDRSITPETGKVVVASLDGEFTVKRTGVDRRSNGWLLPENSKYPVIPVEPETGYSIFGVVSYCLHQRGVEGRVWSTTYCRTA